MKPEKPSSTNLGGELKGGVANLRPFKKGEGGRPKGSRNKLAEDFVADLHAAWQEKGKSVIEAVIAEKPADFLKVVAGVIPKELKIDSSTVEDIPDAELSDYLAIARAAFEAHREAGAGRDSAYSGKPAAGLPPIH